MAKVQWIKVSTDILHNRKIMALRYEKNGNLIILLWFSLLVLAGQTNDNGQIYFTPTIPYTDEKLFRELNIPKAVIREGLDYFQENAMIKIINNGWIHIENWEEYQNFEQLERLKAANRERQKRYYSKHKPNENLTENLTPSAPLANATDKIREDKNREDKKRVEEIRPELDPSEQLTDTNLELVKDSFADTETEAEKKARSEAAKLQEYLNNKRKLNNGN